jgi:hypothetical protein
VNTTTYTDYETCPFEVGTHWNSHNEILKYYYGFSVSICLPMENIMPPGVKADTVRIGLNDENVSFYRKTYYVIMMDGLDRRVV